jgi:hypothetical protein
MNGPEPAANNQDAKVAYNRNPQLQAIDPILGAMCPSPEACLAGVDVSIPDYLEDKLPAAKIQAIYSVMYD